MSLDKTKLFLLIIFPVVLIDQVSKAVVFLNLDHYSCNRGIAFGLLPDFFSWVFYFAILAVLWVLFWKQKNKVTAVGLLMVIAGGTSNLLDRILRQCVLDFLSLGFWPSFNFADSMICAGVVLIIFSYFISRKKH